MRFGLFLLVLLTGCARANFVTPEGAKIAATDRPPPPSCEKLGEVWGKSGGEVGGGIMANDELFDFAMQDLMNQTAAKGGNYVQHEAPTTSKHAWPAEAVYAESVKGVAYRCPGEVRTAP